MTSRPRASFASSRPKLFDADGPSALDIEAYMRSGPRDIPGASPQTSHSQASANAAHPAAARARHDGQPTWADLKTKAGKDRKRLPLACIACRRKKIRCSGEKPACKHCSKSRVPCVYKVTARKAAPRTDYMAMLDRRLKRMEDRVIRIIPKDKTKPNGPRAIVKPALAAAAAAAASAAANNSNNNNSSSSSISAPLQNQHARKRAAADAFGADEVDEWANGSTTADADPRRHAVAKDEGEDEARLLLDGREHLPSPELQTHLVEVYFDFVYGQSYLLLHKPSFIRLMSANKVPPVLLLAICATAARFSTHPDLSSDPAFLRGEVWAAAAQKLALQRIDSPNITILTVLLLLGLHAFGTCQGGRSWMLAGVGHRMAYALQLQRESDVEPILKNGRKVELSFLDREIRRRTMWGCFVMDRFNSSGSERPMFASERNIRVQLPVREDLFQMELPGQTEMLDGGVPNQAADGADDILERHANMGVAAYNVKVIALWGQLIQYWNLGGAAREQHAIWSPDSQWHELCNRLEALREAIPDHLQYGRDNLQAHANEGIANQFLYFHVSYSMSTLFLHRFAFPAVGAYHVPKDMPKEFLSQARRRGVEAASMISTLVGEGLSHRLVAPFSGYSAYLSGIVHVHVIFSRDPKLEAKSKEHLTNNIRFLTQMKKYWGMFYYLTESLKELYRQHADAAGQGTAASQGAEPHGEPKRAVQFGDWYDRYPRGVSQTYYEEPAAKARPTHEAVLSQQPDLQTVEDFFASSAQQRFQHGRPPSKRARAKSQPSGARPASAAGLGRERKQMMAAVDADVEDHLNVSRNAFGFPESYGGVPGTATATAAPMMPSADGGGVFGGSPLGGDGLAHTFWDMDLTGFPIADDMVGSDLASSWFVPFNINVPDAGDLAWSDSLAAAASSAAPPPPPPPSAWPPEGSPR